MRFKAIIIDLDGTLADCEHRKQFITSNERKAPTSKVGDISWLYS
ncbi:hypothetical protein [Fluviispira sanaruensis]|nr:hypothetical protein [Fluviispira sanaruensis]